MRIKEVFNYILSGCPLIYVITYDENWFVKNFVNEVNKYYPSWDIKVWTANLGFAKPKIERDNSNDFLIYESINNNKILDPVKAISNFANEKINKVEGANILILPDFHCFFSEIQPHPAILRAIKDNISILERDGKILLIITPQEKIPFELEKISVICEIDKPNIEDFKNIYKELQGNSYQENVEEWILSRAIGLTYEEAKNVFSYSIVSKSKLDVNLIDEERVKIINKHKLLELFPSVSEEEIGGLDNLKKYLKQRAKGFQNLNLPRPKGILLVGPPGCGKSLTAKATASIFNVPLVRLDISSLKTSLVGESERRLREALKTIDALAPCVVWIDEIEKALSGVQSSGKTDGGTTLAMFGYLLFWMQESQSPKYIVATCNSIEEIMNISYGALIRRFDEVFFIDFPSKKEREEILKIMERKYKTQIPRQIKLNKKVINIIEYMDKWTGAEIEKFVINSIYEGVEEALKNIKTIYQQNKQSIDMLRKWALKNCRKANLN